MVEGMNPKQRARLLRMLLYTGKEPDQRLLRDIAVAAVPGNEDDPSIARFADALRAGRRVKVGTFKVLGFSTDPNISAITAMEIEEALAQVEGGDEHD
jgi:hypothetical protein